MGVSLREVDSEGNTLKVHRVEFTNGGLAPNFYGGTFATTDPTLIKLLDQNPRNQKNGGVDWKLEKVMGEPKTKAEKATKAEVKEVPAIEPVQVEETQETVSESEVKVYEEITTNQEAAKILREIDTTLRVIDVRTKAQIHEVAGRLNVSFPNL